MNHHKFMNIPTFPFPGCDSLGPKKFNGPFEKQRHVKGQKLRQVHVTNGAKHQNLFLLGGVFASCVTQPVAVAKAKATRSDKTGVWETQYQIINSLRTGKWPCIVSFPIRNGDLEDIDHWLVVQFHHLETMSSSLEG